MRLQTLFIPLRVELWCRGAPVHPRYFWPLHVLCCRAFVRLAKSWTILAGAVQERGVLDRDQSGVLRGVEDCLGLLGLAEGSCGLLTVVLGCWGMGWAGGVLWPFRQKCSWRLLDKRLSAYSGIVFIVEPADQGWSMKKVQGGQGGDAGRPIICLKV